MSQRALLNTFSNFFLPLDQIGDFIDPAAYEDLFEEPEPLRRETIAAIEAGPSQPRTSHITIDSDIEASPELDYAVPRIFQQPELRQFSRLPSSPPKRRRIRFVTRAVSISSSESGSVESVSSLPSELRALEEQRLENLIAETLAPRAILHTTAPPQAAGSSEGDASRVSTGTRPQTERFQRLRSTEESRVGSAPSTPEGYQSAEPEAISPAPSDSEVHTHNTPPRPRGRFDPPSSGSSSTASNSDQDHFIQAAPAHTTDPQYEQPSPRPITGTALGTRTVIPTGSDDRDSIHTSLGPRTERFRAPGVRADSRASRPPIRVGNAESNNSAPSEEAESSTRPRPPHPNLRAVTQQQVVRLSSSASENTIHRGTSLAAAPRSQNIPPIGSSNGDSSPTPELVPEPEVAPQSTPRPHNRIVEGRTTSPPQSRIRALRPLPPPQQQGTQALRRRSPGISESHPDYIPPHLRNSAGLRQERRPAPPQLVRSSRPEIRRPSASSRPGLGPRNPVAAAPSQLSTSAAPAQIRFPVPPQESSSTTLPPTPASRAHPDSELIQAYVARARGASPFPGRSIRRAPPRPRRRYYLAILDNALAPRVPVEAPAANFGLQSQARPSTADSSTDSSWSSDGENQVPFPRRPVAQQEAGNSMPPRVRRASAASARQPRRRTASQAFDVDVSDADREDGSAHPPVAGPSRKRRNVNNGNAAGGASSSRAQAEPIVIEDLDDDEVESGEAARMKETLQKQREEQVKAQQAATNGGQQKLSLLQCVICMDTFTDMTATSCGHLFCHECLMNALRASENRRAGAPTAANQKKAQCPVCRAPLNRNKASDVIPLLIMKKGAATQPRRKTG